MDVSKILAGLHNELDLWMGLEWGQPFGPRGDPPLDRLPRRRVLVPASVTVQVGASPGGVTMCVCVRTLSTAARPRWPATAGRLVRAGIDCTLMLCCGCRHASTLTLAGALLSGQQWHLLATCQGCCQGSHRSRAAGWAGLLRWATSPMFE